MIFLLTFAGLSTMGLLLLVHAACCAPEGSEDAQGFHFMIPRDPKTTTPASLTVEQSGLSVASR